MQYKHTADCLNLSGRRSKAVCGNHMVNRCKMLQAYLGMLYICIAPFVCTATLCAGHCQPQTCHDC